ncbi:protein-disulfide reductase DsbD domain-containing protein, partial [uncultured Thalassolituus sp.]
MTLIRSLFVSLLLLSGLWSPGVFAASGEEEEFLRAEEAFQPVVERTGSGWHVRFDIADHYYLYQSRIKLKKPLEGDQVSFRQTAELKNDPNFGEVLIYHNVVDVDVTVTAEGDRVLSYQGCAEAGLCYPPQKLTLSAALAVTEAAPASASAPAAESELGGESLFWVVLSFLGLGIGLSLTPCVFPMIPILSSIIVGQSG